MRTKVRGKVWKSDPATWNVAVIIDGVVVWEDNTGALTPSLTDELAEKLAAFQSLVDVGHEHFESWDSIVERAGKNL